MTQQEALKLSIESVKRDKTLHHTVRYKILANLRALVRNVEKRVWTQEQILEFANDLCEKNGGKLLRNDFGTDKGGPSAYIVQRRFDMSMSEFFETYFPTTAEYPKMVQYRHRKISEWNEQFIAEFKRIQPRSEYEYNAYRTKGCPSANAIKKMNGNIKWTELLEKFDLAVFNKEGVRIERQVYMVTSDIDDGAVVYSYRLPDHGNGAAFRRKAKTASRTEKE